MPAKVTETKQEKIQKERVADGLSNISREKAELADLSAENMRAWKIQVLRCFEAGWTRNEIAEMVEDFTGESCSLPWIAAVLAEVRSWEL